MAYVIIFYHANLFMFQEKRNLILKMRVYVHIVKMYIIHSSIQLYFILHIKYILHNTLIMTLVYLTLVDLPLRFECFGKFDLLLYGTLNMLMVTVLAQFGYDLTLKETN